MRELCKIPSVARKLRDASMIDLYIFCQEAGTTARSSEMALAQGLDCSCRTSFIGVSARGCEQNRLPGM